MDSTTSGRFKDAPWFPQGDTYVVIGGAGGIGTWLSLLLARAGFLPVIYDFDIVEEHNIGGQLFSKKHVGKTKIKAISEVISEFALVEITGMEEKVDEETPNHNFMFSAFDNMQARKDMFKVWKAGLSDPEYSRTAIFIDGRLTMEQLQIFCVTADNVEEYEKHLFDDSEVEDAPCTLKQTSHSAAMIGSHMTAFFTNHITNIVEKDKVREVPFKWEYFIPINYINQE